MFSTVSLYNADMEEKSLIRILAVSDNHSDMEPIRKLPSLFPDMDYYFHCGDSRQPVREYGPYAQVRGNNDFYNVPDQLILEIGEHRIFLTHGTRLVYFGEYHYLAKRARSHNCDIALFGHTHIYADTVTEGVRCLNPGSVWHNRDGTGPSFMILELEGSTVRAFRKEWSSLK